LSSKKLSGLYGITDTTLTPYDRVLEMVTQAIDGGMRILQLRDKVSLDSDIIEIAKSLKKLCDANDVLFIIDDRIELALNIDADGVHIGKDDITPQEAKKLMGEKIVGVSCYGDIEKAKEMERLGMDYVAFGAFFKSPTKPHSNVVDITILSEAKKSLQIPICAIGGITRENSPEIIAHGADMVSVISDLWVEDIEKSAQEFTKIIEKG